GGVRIAGTQEGLTAVENDVARATFSNRGAVLTSFVLLKHADDQKRPLELVRAIPDPSAKPLALVFPGKPALTQLASTAPTAGPSTDSGLQRVSAQKLEKETAWPLPANGFAGIEDNYFLTALVPRHPAAAQISRFALPAAPGDPASKPEPLVSVGVASSGT